MTDRDRLVHRGGCHCGRVHFEFLAPASVNVSECNCSICSMVGYQHLIVPKRDFKLLSGQELILTYRFGTEVAQHYFCSHCGVKSFYVPRSHPHGISVNFRCVDQRAFTSVSFSRFDGRNWERNVAGLDQVHDLI